jgi:hypothetical protein
MFAPCRSAVTFAAPLLILSMLACSRERKPDYASLDLAQVTGTITLDGQPLAGATVMFDSQEGRRAMGTTDTGGRYNMMHNSEQPGVTGGTHVVRIRSRPWVEGEEEGEVTEGSDASGAATELVPARYNSASELTVEVGSGKSHTFDFELKSQP